MLRTPQVIEKQKKFSFKLDGIDRQILFILQQNARASTKQIAEMIGGLSKVAVAYRIRRLIREGVIEGFTTKVNGDKVDRGYIIITRIICSAKGPKESEVSEKIAKIPGVQSVYRIFGPYDIMVIGRCKNREAARDLVYEIIGTGGVRTTNTMVAHTAVKESIEVDVQPLNIQPRLLQGQSSQVPQPN